MSETNNEATQNMDESSVADFDFDSLADEVLGLEPDEATQELDETTEELEDDNPIVDEDADTVGEEERDEEEDEAEVEDESEDATQDEEVDESDAEVDMDFKVPVKIDGEMGEVTMEELIANYQTKQHQSKKGDELAEHAKALEGATQQAQLYAQVNAQLINQEDSKDQRVLKALQDKVDKAYADDDFEAGKLNNQLAKAKEEYGSRKASRDNLMQGMSQQMGQQQQEQFTKQVEHFNEVVPELIPDWSPEVAQANRQFAINIGLDERVVDTMTDPMMVRAIDGFRRLAESSIKGTAKRKKAPVKRVPTKKPSSTATKKSNRVEQSRHKIAKGKGTENDDKVLFDNAIDNLFGS
jgi:hypothetical protein